LAAPHPLRPPPSPTPDSPHPAAAAPPPSTLSLHDALPIWGCVSTPAPAPPRRPMLRRSASPAPCVAAVAARPPGSVLWGRAPWRSEEHTSELQSRFELVCRLLLDKKKARSVKTTGG